MIVLIVLWILFFISHSLLAADSIKAAAEKVLGNFYRFYRIGYNLFSAFFLSGIMYILLFNHELNYVYEFSKYSKQAGWFFLFMGVLIMIISFRNYDLAEFTGIKQLAQKIHRPEKLVIKGLNAYVRNPLYFGIIILALGYFLQQPTYMNLVSVLIIYAYLYIGTTLEEKKLEAAFGNEYTEYKKQVKMLLPYLF